MQTYGTAVTVDSGARGVGSVVTGALIDTVHTV